MLTNNAMYLISNQQMETVIRLLELVKQVPGSGTHLYNQKRISSLLIKALSKKKPVEQKSHEK